MDVACYSIVQNHLLESSVKQASKILLRSSITLSDLCQSTLAYLII
jgi:hypothetical protein